MNMIVSETLLRDYAFPGSVPAPTHGTVAIFSDDADTIASFAPVCEFLGLHLEVVSEGIDLTTVLRTRRPLAVICDVDGKDHDGFHAMKLIARYNPDLP